MATNHSGFPAPTIPYSLSDDEDDDQPHNRHHPPPSTFANKVLPPTPSPLTSASGRLSKDLPQIPAESSRSNTHPPVDGGIDVQRWISDSDSQVHEMDMYHGHSDDEEAGLTSTDRRKARLPKRGIGIRIGAGDESEEALMGGDNIDAEEDDILTPEEKKEADGLVVRNLAINLILIGLWYIFSLLISIYNKWMFSPEHLDFNFPLFTTCLHMCVQFSLSSLVLFAFPHLRPPGFFGAAVPESAPGAAASTADDSDGEGWFSFNSSGSEDKKRRQGVMTKWVYLTKIFPCGAATGLDIGLGNMSLKFITLAFYTMCKSSSLAFVLVFAFVFRLEKITWKLIGIISVMTIGVVMMVASEAKFVVIGFVLVILASALSGLRWSLTQMLLIRNPATSNPFSSIFFLAPCMFISILTIAIPVEGFGPLFERFGVLVESEGFFRAFGIILFPGIIAFLMVSSEFALLKRSSVVTLSICGIFKEVITISAAAVIFNDPLTPVNISGLMVTIVSIALYNYIKISKMRQEALEKTHHMHHPEGCHVDHHITDTGYSAVSGAELDDEAEAGIEVALSTGSKSHRRTLSRSHDEEDHHNIIQVGESAVSPMFPGLVDATTK